MRSALNELPPPGLQYVASHPMFSPVVCPEFPLGVSMSSLQGIAKMDVAQRMLSLVLKFALNAEVVPLHMSVWCGSDLTPVCSLLARLAYALHSHSGVEDIKIHSITDGCLLLERSVSRFAAETTVSGETRVLKMSVLVLANTSNVMRAFTLEKPEGSVATFLLTPKVAHRESGRLIQQTLPPRTCEVVLLEDGEVGRCRRAGQEGDIRRRSSQAALSLLVSTGKTSIGDDIEAATSIFVEDLSIDAASQHLTATTLHRSSSAGSVSGGGGGGGATSGPTPFINIYPQTPFAFRTAFLPLEKIQETSNTQIVYKGGGRGVGGGGGGGGGSPKVVLVEGQGFQNFQEEFQNCEHHECLQSNSLHEEEEEEEMEEEEEEEEEAPCLGDTLPDELLESVSFEEGEDPHALYQHICKVVRIIAREESFTEAERVEPNPAALNKLCRAYLVEKSALRKTIHYLRQFDGEGCGLGTIHEEDPPPAAPSPSPSPTPSPKAERTDIMKPHSVLHLRSIISSSRFLPLSKLRGVVQACTEVGVEPSSIPQTETTTRPETPARDAVRGGRDRRGVPGMSTPPTTPRGGDRNGVIESIDGTASPRRTKGNAINIEDVAEKAQSTPEPAERDDLAQLALSYFDQEFVEMGRELQGYTDRLGVPLHGIVDATVREEAEELSGRELASDTVLSTVKNKLRFASLALHWKDAERGIAERVQQKVYKLLSDGGEGTNPSLNNVINYVVSRSVTLDSLDPTRNVTHLHKVDRSKVDAKRHAHKEVMRLKNESALEGRRQREKKKKGTSGPKGRTVPGRGGARDHIKKPPRSPVRYV